MNPAIRHVLAHRPKFNRVEAFDEISDQLTDQEYWRLAGHIWSRKLVPKTATYFYAARWHKIFQSPRAHRSHVARVPADRTLWDNMDDAVIAYRGCGTENSRGVFFTLDYSIAEMFASIRTRRGQKGQVYARLFNKADCVFLGGKQQELVYLPMLRAVRAFDSRYSAQLSPITIPYLQARVDFLKQKMDELEKG